MKLVLNDPCLFDVFEKDPTTTGIATAQVLDSRNTRVSLSGVAGSIISLPVDPKGVPAKLMPRQVVRFNAQGEFVDKVELARTRRE